MSQPVNPTEFQFDTPPEIDLEARFKQSQKILLGSAGTYILMQLVDFFVITGPNLKETYTDLAKSNPEWSKLQSFETFQTITYAAGIGATVIVTALFGLVYLLMAKHINAGRIIGFIFASFGICAALFNMIGGIPIMIILDIVWIGLNISWIVTAASKEVSAVMG